MKTILITAYAVNPYKGSEDGTGWNITAEIARDYKVILITRRNNVNAVKAFIEASSEPHLKNIQCFGFDLSDFVMKWKKRLGERGYVGYYYLWQYYMPKFIQQQGFEFDIAHSLNFHSDSQPNFLWKLGKPTFWGPIGHHPKVNRNFLLKHFPISYWVKDNLYAAVKWLFRNIDPSFRRSIQASTKIFTINSTVEKVIAAPKEKVVQLPAVASHPVRPKKLEPQSSSKFTILSVGRFHYLKGFDLTLEAFAQFLGQLPLEAAKDCTLKIVGKGPEKERLTRLANRLNIYHQIEWISWVDKSEMDAIYRSSDVFLFPSYEGAGMVIPEAMSYQLPVLCFDNCGPGELIGDAGIRVPYTSYHEATKAFANHLKALYQNPNRRALLGVLAKNRFTNHFTWTVKGHEIKKHYRDAC
jgi:glycosyltransferase involved in cell wall biosynthesis